MIRRFDMSLPENLQARWEMERQLADSHDRVAKELGCELFTRFVPLMDAEVMQNIYEDTKAMLNDRPLDEALARGKTRVREAIFS